MRVRERFAELQAMDEKSKKINWYIIDASKTIDEVQSDINEVVTKTMANVKNGKPLFKMFDDGEYNLPPRSSTEDGK